MPWQETASSGQQSSAIEGLYYLHGDVLARQFGQSRLKGKTYPTIAFPSGVTRELTDPQSKAPSISLFGNLEIPLTASPDFVARLVGARLGDAPITVSKPNADTLVIENRESLRRYRLSFRQGRISDIALFPREAMELLPGHLRAVLPPIRTTNGKGWEAVAPLKIFTPDSNWTWYPTEFDGVDEFFGLVIGFEAELGYFSLSELERLRGGLGLPLERDLYYTPKSLQELYDAHLYST